jgi:hypothetical protein
MIMVDADESVSVSVPALAALAVEYWRLVSWLNAANAASSGPARHAVRKLGDFLKANDLEVEAMEGKTFDPGMAVVVVDTLEDDQLEDGKAVIEETVSPMVLWKGKVVKNAEVVTRVGKR